MRRDFKPKKSRLPMLALIAVVLLGLGFAAHALFGTDKEVQKAALEAQYAAAPVIQAEALAQAWREGGDAHTKQNRMKVIAVAGEVSRTEDYEGSFGKHITVYLTGLEGAEIEARVEGEHMAAVSGLKRGDKVTLVGIYKGDDGRGALVMRAARKR